MGGGAIAKFSSSKGMLSAMVQVENVNDCSQLDSIYRVSRPKHQPPARLAPVGDMWLLMPAGAGQGPTAEPDEARPERKGERQEARYRMRVLTAAGEASEGRL